MTIGMRNGIETKKLCKQHNWINEYLATNKWSSDEASFALELMKGVDVLDWTRALSSA